MHTGSGEVRTQFGVIDYEPLDLIVVPRGTIIDWRPNADPQRLVVLESMTDIKPPSRYLSSSGQFLEASPYCERDFKVPRLCEPVADRGSFEVILKTRRHLTSSWLQHHPFDVVGWDGCFYPYALNARDFEPIVQRIHTMPNMHQVFATENAAICLFVPRAADYHPMAIPAAPNHASVDCDEMFYVIDGSAMGRQGDGPGSMTFHPRGIPHGPKPGKYEKSIGIREHTAYAYMIDTFRPLRVATTAGDCEDLSYPEAWVTQPGD